MKERKIDRTDRAYTVWTEIKRTLPKRFNRTMQTNLGSQYRLWMLLLAFKHIDDTLTRNVSPRAIWTKWQMIAHTVIWCGFMSCRNMNELRDSAPIERYRFITLTRINDAHEQNPHIFSNNFWSNIWCLDIDILEYTFSFFLALSFHS